MVRALKQEKTVNGRPKYAIFWKEQATYYENWQNSWGDFQRVRRFRVPDILVRQNRHELLEPDSGLIKTGSRKLMLLERDATSAVTPGQIRKVASCAKDLRTKACALVLSPGTPVSQVAEIEANMLGVGLIRDHGCQQRLQDDIQDFVNLHLTWEARPKEQDDLPCI